jgi:5-dehydro-2-deoxygluconokinase
MSSKNSSGKKLDVICLGRAAVDLYGQQVGGRLEDMQSFSKYLGGSSGNLAAGLARLGVKSAMLTRVGDEQMGRFVREQLSREGVDVSQVRTDPDRLTGLVLLGIGSANNIPHIFFRERCADMGLCKDDVDQEFIASARMLAVTGTHLSTETTRDAVVKAIAAARKGATRVVLDIDYRPVLWGLTSPGEGASRFAESGEITSIVQRVLPDCDLIVGTEEEIAIAGGNTDTTRALQAIRGLTDAVIVLKRGASGCSVFEAGPISSTDDGIAVTGADIEVFNTVGAGDAFLSGFLYGVLNDLPPAESGVLGNACGALVVARHGCTPAMPSRVELDAWLSRTPPPRQPRNDPELAHLHRTTTWHDDPRPLCVLAFDHRSQFEQIAAKYGRTFESISEFKELIAEAVLDVVAEGDASVRYGAIVDHRYGTGALARLSDASIWTGTSAAGLRIRSSSACSSTIRMKTRNCVTSRNLLSVHCTPMSSRSTAASSSKSSARTGITRSRTTRCRARCVGSTTSACALTGGNSKPRRAPAGRRSPRSFAIATRSARVWLFSGWAPTKKRSVTA